MKKDASADGSYPYRKDHPRLRRWITKTAGGIFLPLFRLAYGYRVTGLEHLADSGSAVITVCNHVHYFDCVMMGLALYPREMRFLSLKSNLQTPVRGPLLALLGAWPLPDGLDGWRNLRGAAEELLGRGGVLHIYPEGSRQTDCRELRPFQKGAFTLAAEFEAALQPCVLRHYPRVRRDGHRTRDGRELAFLEPLRTDDTLSRGKRAAALERAAENSMRQALCAPFQKEDDRSP